MLQAKDRWLKHGGMENYVVIGRSLKTYFKSAKYLHRLLTLKFDLQNVGPRIYGHPAYLDAKSQSVFVHLTEVPLYCKKWLLHEPEAKKNTLSILQATTRHNAKARLITVWEFGQLGLYRKQAGCYDATGVQNDNYNRWLILLWHAPGTRSTGLQKKFRKSGTLGSKTATHTWPFLSRSSSSWMRRP